MSRNDVVAGALCAVVCSTVAIASPSSVPDSTASRGPSVAAAQRLAHPQFAGLHVGERVAVDGFDLGDGVPVDLDLERFDVLAPDARLVVAGAGGERDLAWPDVVLLRGSVRGAPGSRVFIGTSPYGIQGFVALDGDVRIISSGAYAPGFTADRGVYVTDAADLPAFDGAAGEAPGCGVGVDDDWLRPFGRPAPAGGAGAGVFPTPCRLARMALDTDYEFTANLFGGDLLASAAYAEFLLAADTEIYIDEFNVRLAVTYLRLWSTNSDPYSGGGLSNALDQFRNEWVSHQQNIERDLAHLLCGRGIGGGIAYIGAVCSEFYGFGVSGNLNGSFPYPLEDHNNANWDVYVSAHEIGHNFGTGHTHDSYDPPLDGCGNGDCNGAENGTIMSYCHQCPGGVANINLHFHPVVRQTILAYLDGACDLTIQGANALDDDIPSFEGLPVTIDVLQNDEQVSCDPPELESFDPVGTQGGTITLVPGGEGEHDQLLYTPAEGVTGADYFGYTLVGGSTAVVRVILTPLLDADATGATDPGATVDYYALSTPDLLPDFDALTPYASDVATLVNYPSTNGNFATSGLADDVGAVFEGFVVVPAPGIYTFYTESDDGSRLLVGNEVVVNNDGLHAMQEHAGDIGLHVGAHAVRIEFFERGGGAGLIARIAGPGLSKQVIPASMWRHGVPCGFDLDGTDDVGFSDVIEMLAEWGPCPPTCPADFDGDGMVGFSDLLALLAEWGPCL